MASSLNEEGVDLVGMLVNTERRSTLRVETVDETRCGDSADMELEPSIRAMPTWSQQYRDADRQSRPQITCGHKRPRCPTCQQCSYCGCDHDGIPVAVKLSRRVGQHGPVSQNALKRAANQYVPGAYFESPMTPQAPSKSQASNQGASAIVTRSTTQGPSTRESTNLATRLFQLPCAADVLRALDLTSLVQYFYNHAPSSAQRSLPVTWQSRDDSKVKAAIKVTTQAIEQLCFLLCEGDKVSGQALCQLAASAIEYRGKDERAVKVLDNIIDCYAKSQKQSVEKRVLRACLSVLTINELKDVVQIPKASYVRGREDLQLLRDGNRLPALKRSLQRFDTNAVEEAVAFILSPEFVSFFSWGSKRLRIGEQAYVFPSIMRRQSRTHIFEAYATHIETTSTKMIKRSTFFKIVSALTDGDAQQRSSIDYVVGFLVNDTMRLLERIVRDLIPAGEDQQKLLDHLRALEVYLKYGFDSQLRDNELSCVLHHIQFGLGGRTTKCQHPESIPCTNNCPPPVAFICSDCRQVFNVYSTLEAHLRRVQPHPSVFKVVSDCAHKARLYLGHRVRVVNQQLAIEAKTKEIRERSASGNAVEAVVLLDFKMKLEPIYNREKTVDHYGKRGISWHGSVVQFYDCPSAGAEDCGAPESRKLYYDHICKGDSKQDKDAVVSILEAVLIRIKSDLPGIKRMTLQSDNAVCYQNLIIPLLLPFLSWIHGVNVNEFLHTETQDGKGIIDAHFARSMGVIRYWTKEGHDCRTPTEIVLALKSHGGLPNTTVELIDHNREKLSSLVKMVEMFDAKIRKYIKRANHIKLTMLDPVDPVRAPSTCEGYSSCPRFLITLFEYSGIGNGYQFVCNPADASCNLVGELTCSQNDLQSTHPPTDGDGTVVDDGEIFGPEEDVIAIDVLPSDDSDSDEEECGDDEIEVDVRIGAVTGVRVATQGQIRRRTRPSQTLTEKAPLTEGVVTSRDAVAYAIRQALKMQRIGEIVLRDARRPNIDSSGPGTNDHSTSQTFSHGWAVRPAWGTTYGERYVDNFVSDIEALFREGEVDPSKKAGPGQMLEILRRQHPGRYDLPSENEIRQEIGKLKRRPMSVPTPRPRPTDMPVSERHQQTPDPTEQADASQRRQQPLTPTSDAICATAQTRRRGRPVQPLTTFIEAMLANNPRIPPSSVIPPIRQAFPDCPLSDTQLSAKIAGIKSKKRRVAPPSSNE